MTDASPEHRTETPAVPGLARRLWLARFAIGWERIWPAVWPALTVAGLFCIVALLDLLPRLHWALHAAGLTIFAAAFAVAVWRIRHVFALPGRAEGRRRLERASGFSHRPLAALEDEMAGANQDPATRTLWEAHRRRLLARLADVRVGPPHPGLPTRDPRALRAVLVLGLAVAIGVGGDRAGINFARAFVPGVDVAAVPPGALDLWITPPAYTGLPPVLPRAETTSIAVPVGSQLIAQVSGGNAPPRLMLDGKPVPFAPIDLAASPAPTATSAAPASRLQSWRVASELTAGSRLTVEQGKRSLGAWDLSLIPDAVPTVEFVQPPHASQRATLRMEYRAKDDYGLAGVVAEIRRETAPDKPAGAGAPIDLALPLAGPRSKDSTAATFFDLTAHPWAGLQVTVTLKATDVAGQTGVSEPISIVLPERVFQHPVARAIVEQRKLLIAEPGLRAVIARALAAIASNPLQFAEDPVVLLALRVGALRLQKPVEPGTIDEMQALMWDTALRIEDGRLSAAERELRAIQQKLQDALANNAPDSEIERLMAELQQAIDKYLQSLVEQAMKNPGDQRQQPQDRNAQRLDRNDLQKLLDQARQLARTGAREAAKDLLARLQEMLENLRTMQANREGQRGQPGDGQAQEMMKSLQEMMQRQQSLIDRTFRRSQQNRPGQFRPGQQGQRGQQSQQGQQGQQGEGEGEGDDAGEQDALRGALADMMRQLEEMMGGAPDGFGRADRSMGESGEQLRRGAPGRALRPQMDALDQLRAGAREALRQMMERFGQGEGEGMGDEAFGDREQADQRDPLGRNPEGDGTSLSDNFQRIPGIGEGAVARSQEILDELIRRLGERTRPTAERDYLERLLRRF